MEHSFAPVLDALERKLDEVNSISTIYKEPAPIVEPEVKPMWIWGQAKVGGEASKMSERSPMKSNLVTIVEEKTPKKPAIRNLSSSSSAFTGS